MPHFDAQLSVKLEIAFKVADFKPLPTKPTNADLASGIEQVHGCLEEFKKATKLQHEALRAGQLSTVRKINNVQTNVENKIYALQEDIERVTTNQILVNKSLGLINDGAKKKPKPVFLMAQGEIAVKSASLLGGIFLLWKLADFVLPKFVQFVLELNKWVQL